MNTVVLRGTLSSTPNARSLPSGDQMGSFEVTVRSDDRPAESIPVVWFDPPGRALLLAAGTEVVVTGRVRRRFFRTPAGTGSRTEVVADVILPATQRKRVLGAIDVAVASVTADAS